MPLPRDVTVLRAESAHSPKPSRMSRDLLRSAPGGADRPGRSVGAPRRNARKCAHERPTASMPVAYDANAAYSASRGDAKAMTPKRVRPPGPPTSSVLPESESSMTTLPGQIRTILSTLWITRARDDAVRLRTRAARPPGRGRQAAQARDVRPTAARRPGWEPPPPPRGPRRPPPDPSGSRGSSVPRARVLVRSGASEPGAGPNPS